MEAQIVDGRSNTVHEAEDRKFDMDKCSEAESAEDWDRGGRFDGNMDGQDLLAYISDTQDFLEEMEGRLLVSAMVADAVTNGIVNAVLEESSQSLAGQESEIVALNDKLEDRDAKLWKLEETLRYNHQESRSETEKLVMNFMHEKDRMQRKLNAMEQQIKCLQEVDSSNRREISALVEKLKRAQKHQDTDHSLVREETLQNEHIEDLQRAIKEKNERIGFLEWSISEKDKSIMSLKQNSLQLQNMKTLEVALREESEGQMLRQEIERCVENTIYEGQLQELRDMLEGDRLQSKAVVFDIQQKLERLKEDSETELTTKKLEILDLADKVEENEINNGLQTTVIVGLLETFIQEFEYQMSQFRQDLDFKNGHIDSLATKLDCLGLECERLQAQISSNHVIEAEIENNLSTLKATMEIQCSKMKEELKEERAIITDNMPRIAKLQTANDSLAGRLREYKLNLERLEEKLWEQQWQQETECQLVNQVYENKLIEDLQLISDLRSKLEKKDMELAVYFKTALALGTAQNDERPEVLRLQERPEGFESQIGCLHGVDSVFGYINSKFLDMTLKLDGLEETSKMFLQHIQSQVDLYQEEHLDQQWKYDFEEQIRELVLGGFLKDLEGCLKIKEHMTALPSLPNKVNFQKLQAELKTALPSMSSLSSFSNWHLPDLLANCLPESLSHINRTEHCVLQTMKQDIANIIAPYLQRPITRWPFFVFLGGAMFCLLASSSCHLLSCHSELLSYVMLRFDYAGIAALIATSFYPPVYYSFMCKPFFRNMYLGIITFGGVVTMLASLLPVFQHPKFRTFRASLFFGMGVSGIAPILHKVVLYKDDPVALYTTAYEIAMGVCYGLGAVVYATRIPERWKPGKFDIAGNSHQLFHVLVVAGACTHYKASLLYLEWRDAKQC